MRDSGFQRAMLWVLEGNERGERFYRSRRLGVRRPQDRRLPRCGGRRDPLPQASVTDAAFGAGRTPPAPRTRTPTTIPPQLTHGALLSGTSVEARETSDGSTCEQRPDCHSPPSARQQEPGPLTDPELEPAGGVAGRESRPRPGSRCRPCRPARRGRGRSRSSLRDGARAQSRRRRRRNVAGLGRGRPGAAASRGIGREPTPPPPRRRPVQ